ncbi:MAG: hypothetical protein HUU25_12295 [Candidatus Sumerlaeia bacterium]|nr:hypothetical protein [Candidatus Sumerlaeia bacterium]
MRRLAIIATAVAAVTPPAAALTNSDFSNFGAGWTQVTGGSGSVSFDGLKCTLNAFFAALAGIEQAETAFTTPGQEFEMSVTVLSVGNVIAGWRNAADVVAASTIYANGATGTRTVRTDDPTSNIVFVEKTGAVGGIIDIDDVTATEITAPPAFAGLATALRTDPGEADLTWAAATDNVSPANQIEYNVYWSTTLANVFTDGVRDTFTGGATGGTITGIPGTTVHVAVRAADRVGNEDTNTAIITLGALSSVDSWESYR